MDATEPVIEPMATMDIKQLEEMKKIGGANVTGDVLIDRQVEAPGIKITKGILTGAVMLAPLVAGIALAPSHGFVAGHFATASKWLADAACVYAGWRGTKFLAKQGFLQKSMGRVVSGIKERKMAEPMWSGRRTYEIAADASPRFDSRITSQGPLPAQRSADDISNFLTTQMQKYPAGHSVIHMMGHGLGYRYTSGLPFASFEKVLQNTTDAVGKPADILLLESCLQSNFEALAATFPYARYAVVSEETIAAGGVGEMLKNTMESVAGQAVTPRDLGKAMIENAVPNPMKVMARAMASGKQPSQMDMMKAQMGDRMVPTLALIDMEKIPNLMAAVDRLGTVLAGEVADGRHEYIKAAVDATPGYPQPALFEGMRKKAALGDLKAFSDRVWKVYGGGIVDVPGSKFGPFKWGTVKQFPEARTSPHSADIQAAAQAVIAAVDDSIVEKHMADSYKNGGGISVQMPGKKVNTLEQSGRFKKMGLTRFEDSAAPAGWRNFVRTMSDKM